MRGDSTYPPAIDVGSSCVKLVQLGRGRAGFFLSRLGMSPVAPGAVQGGCVRDGEEVARAVLRVLSNGEGKEKKVVVALPGRAAMLKTVLLPQEEGFPVRDAMEAEALQVLPVPLDEVRLSHLRIGPLQENGKTMDEYLMIAVRRKPFRKLLDVFRSMDWKPVVVDVNLLALEGAFFLSEMNQKGETVALVDVGASETLVNVVRDAHTLIARAIPFGGMGVTEAIARRLEVSREEAEAIKLGRASPPNPRAVADAIREEAENLARELRQTFRLIWGMPPWRHIGRVILSGGGASLEDLPSHLDTMLDLPVDILDPFRRVEVPEGRFEPHFVASLSPVAAIGAGLAYRAAESG